MGIKNTPILTIESIKKELVGKQFIWDTTQEEKILWNINEMGIHKFIELIGYKHDINSAIDLFIADMKLSRFFWRHIRRIESKFKAVLINYFYVKGDPKIFDENQIIIKDFLIDYTNYTSEKNLNNNKKAILKRNKSIISKINKLASNFSKKDACVNGLIEYLSLGKLIDFSVLLLFDDEATKESVDMFYKTKSLTTLRNKISHFYLLLNTFKSEDLQEFWNIMKKMSDSGKKETKNDIEFISLLKDFHL